MILEIYQVKMIWFQIVIKTFKEMIFIMIIQINLDIV
jgi:hypothetical protein